MLRCLRPWGRAVWLTVCLASPALANNAIPLGGLPELLTAMALFVILVPLAVLLTFFPKLAPTQPAFQGLLATIASAGCLAILWLTLQLMDQEFRPGDYREYWTGVFFLLPFTLCVCALTVVIVRRRTDAPKRHLLLAWAVPIGLWFLVSLILYLVGTMPSHF